MTELSKPEVLRHPWRHRYPHLGTAPIPAEKILSQEIFDLQRDKIFKKVWLHVGRVEAIPRPGDYFVTDIAIAHASIIITRKNDGSVGAFYNICTHRGNKLIWDNKGCRKAFSCGFHGWVFNSSGNLVNVPDIEDFYDLDKSSLDLHSVRVDTWAGFIFVNLDAAGAQSLEDYLGEPGRRLREFPFARDSAHSLWRTDVNSNWQLIADAQAESYHVPYIHARMSAADGGGGAAQTNENPHCRLTYFEAFGDHCALTIPYDPDFVPKGAVERAAHKYGPFFTNPDRTLDYGLPTAINTGGTEDWVQQISCFFPNFNIMIHRNMWATHQMWPVSLNTAVWEIGMGHAPPQSAAARFTQEQLRCFFREGITEDGATHEQSQKVLESGELKEFQLKDDEMALRLRYAVSDRYISA